MREQLSQLSLLQLRDIAKSKGIKNIAAIRKSALVEQIAKILEREDAEKEAQNRENTSEKESSVRESSENLQPDQNAPAEGKDPTAVEIISEPKADEQSIPEPENFHLKTSEHKPFESKSSEPAVSAPKPTANTESSAQETAPSYRSGGYSRERQPSRTRINTYSNNRPSVRTYSSNADRNPEFSHQENRRISDNTEISPAPRGRYRSNPRTETKQDAFNPADYAELDSGENAHGILEIMADGYGFIRSENFLPGDNDVYVSPAQIRRFNMKTGDFITGSRRVRTQDEKFQALLYISQINGRPPHEAECRTAFEDLTPVFPNARLHLETFNGPQSMRIMDLISPIGKGQRGMIVSPPKAGKTTLLKQVAKAVTANHPEMHLIILLIDERPEEVTDIKESIEGTNVEVIYSTFDEQPEHHKRVTEMVLERAKRLVEHKRDVMILLDSITRLARAYNLLVTPSGRTLSGGLDPASLYLPKRFFGAARNMREGGSLTILATALVETGSRMDDVIFEEFKGTGNMELVLDRKLSEKRIFPAIELLKSGTRRDDLLLNPAEQEATAIMRKATTGLKPEEAAERILELFAHTKTNREFVDVIRRQKFI